MGLRTGLKAVTLATTIACGGGNSGLPDAAAECGTSCMDATAMRALRNAIKIVYNATLPGQPVGMQDRTTTCLLGGGARVLGQATSNAAQGTTSVELTYVLAQCAYSETHSDPTQTFAMTLTGTVTESGIIAVQPSSTTSLQFHSDAMTFSGTVYSPPIDYSASACMVVLGQDGNDLSGSVCGRAAGLTL